MNLRLKISWKLRGSKGQQRNHRRMPREYVHTFWLTQSTNCRTMFYTVYYYVLSNQYNLSLYHIQCKDVQLSCNVSQSGCLWDINQTAPSLIWAEGRINPLSPVPAFITTLTSKRKKERKSCTARQVTSGNFHFFGVKVGLIGSPKQPQAPKCSRLVSVHWHWPHLLKLEQLRQIQFAI